MNKQQFLAALREKIDSLPQNDINRSLDYYSEMIDDRIEDGMSETDAVAAMGSVEDIAAHILGDASSTVKTEAVKPESQPKPAKNNNGWLIFLLILGAPVWIPVMIAVLIVILTVFVVLWAAVIAFWAALLGIAVAAVGCVVGGIILALTLHPVPATVCVGSGFICGGAAILLFFLFKVVTHGVIWLCKGIFRGVRAMFSRRKA